MGNWIEMTIEAGESSLHDNPVTRDTFNPGYYFVLSGSDFKRLKSLVKSTDGETDIDAKRLPDGSYKVYSMWVEGAHGEYKDIFDRAGEFAPLRGVMRVHYFDHDAPERATRTVRKITSGLGKVLSLSKPVKVTSHVRHLRNHPAIVVRRHSRRNPI